MPLSAVGKLPKCFPASKVVPSFPLKAKKRSNASQVEGGKEVDDRHVKDPLLNKVESGKGTRSLSRVVGYLRLRIQLYSSDD